MQATLEAMVGRNHLEEYQTGFQQFDVVKQAVILGVGKTGNNERVYIAQLWIGRKSVFTVEAELIGDHSTASSDEMFAQVLHSIRHESWPKKAFVSKKASEVPAAEQTAPSPAPAVEPPPAENAAPHDNSAETAPPAQNQP
jgi:hypothetical protein